jgi:hypothetical protein
MDAAFVRFLLARLPIATLLVDLSLRFSLFLGSETRSPEIGVFPEALPLIVAFLADRPAGIEYLFI